MGTIAETIFILAIRQSISIRRVAVLLILAAIPLVIAIISELVNADWDGEVTQGFIQGLIFNTGLPLIALIVAAPVFADEIEDRTLTNLMLSPISRWQISIPKMLAAVFIVAIPLAISTFVSILLVFEDENYSAAILGAFGILVGSLAFVSLFAFVGTLTTRAVVFGIVYVFGFEALISTAIPGLKYVSISGNTLSILQELNSTLIDTPTSGSNQLPPIEYAIIALIAVIIISNIATVWRLKRMDVH
ncbi:MAG: ABC transporter permease subunit [Chloroflexi bacterium]|nr:ABC transporter permease subunit [Chloroflexota bacterium]